MEIVEPSRDQYEELVELRVTRVPSHQRPLIEEMFTAPAVWDFMHVRAAAEGDTLLGWSAACRPTTFLPDWALAMVTVAGEHEGRGVGSALYRAVLQLVPPEIVTLLAPVIDDDPRSKEIAESWGHTVLQHGINSELDLVDLPEPELPPGVTMEDVSDLSFPDGASVDAMLRASQTNPEAQVGIMTRLSDVHAQFEALDRPLAVLARVDGAPAAIVTGDVTDEVLHIHYTGVDPAYRGRNLGFRLKQFAHLAAVAAGARVSKTANEETNAGIRHVNARLGYRITAGFYRMPRTLR